MRALLEHGADVDTVSEEGETLLMRVVTQSEHTSRVLLQYGASIDRVYNNGNTLLLESIRYLTPYMVRFDLALTLLEYGADVNQYNLLSNDTPLKLACIACNTVLVRLLLERGADPLLCPTGSEGLSVVEMMREGGAQYDAVRMICEEYIDTKPLMK